MAELSEAMKAHQWRPGQSGNPKGRPKGIGWSIIEHVESLAAEKESGEARTTLEELQKIAGAPARSRVAYARRVAAKEMLECLKPGRYGTIALHRMLDRLIGYPVASVDLKAQLSCEKRIFIVEDFDRVKFEGPHGVIDAARIDPATGKELPDVVDTASLSLPPP